MKFRILLLVPCILALESCRENEGERREAGTPAPVMTPGMPTPSVAGLPGEKQRGDPGGPDSPGAQPSASPGAGESPGELTPGGAFDAAFFATLDLERPDLAEVGAAVTKHDYPAATKALARHLRERPTPKFPQTGATPAPSDRRLGSDSPAERALRLDFTIIGKPHQFQDKIDWEFMPPGVNNTNWPQQLNRHAAWSDLADAYAKTGNPEYVRGLSFLLRDWVAKNPPPNAEGELKKFGDEVWWKRGGNVWADINAGIRAGEAWPKVFYSVLRSPDLSDEDLVLWMKSFGDHARYLMVPKSKDNHFAMATNGLFTVGALFPEFKESASWRDEAMSRVKTEISAQVYPDGTQTELTPWYHMTAMRQFMTIAELARLNGIPLPENVAGVLEKMHAYFVQTAEPGGSPHPRSVPRLNDSENVSVPNLLAKALDVFPDRGDFRWLATDGKEGTPPAFTSTLVPYAGQVVMRASWDKDANYLLMDAGPFGTGHQHEDKLSLNVSAYGHRMIIDPGRYAYVSKGSEDSKFRDYCLTTMAHSTVLVDGKGQNRRAARATWKTEQPMSIVWQTTPQFDYASASYGEIPGETYKDAAQGAVVHRRQVLFVKPHYWIVVDTVGTGESTLPAKALSLFHLADGETVLDKTTGSVVLRLPGGPSMAIVPLLEEGLTAKIVKGQENPFLLGWDLSGGGGGRHPIPVVCYEQAINGPTTTFAYAFVPFPIDATVVPPQVSKIAGTGGTRGIRVTFPDASKNVEAFWNGAGPVSVGNAMFDAPFAIRVGNSPLQPVGNQP